jgi:hypothetical protein
VLDSYLRTTVPPVRHVAVPLPAEAMIDDLTLTVRDETAEQVEAPRRDEPLTFEVAFTARQPLRALDMSVFIIDRHGVRIVNENLSDAGRTISGPPQAYRIRLVVPPLLAAGDYVVGMWLGTNDELVFRGEVLRMTVRPLPSDREGSVHGAVRPSVQWNVETPPAASAP